MFGFLYKDVEEPNFWLLVSLSCYGVSLLMQAMMPSDSDGDAAGPIADHAGEGDLVARDSDSDATLVLPGRGSDEEEGEEGKDESSGSEEEEEEEPVKAESDDAMEAEEDSEMEANESDECDADVPEGPSGSNGVKDAGPVCERFGPGKMCDGRGCHPCMNALLSPNRHIYKTPDSKSCPFEKDMSEEKKPMPANPEESDVTWL